jgi:beta-galactosidase
MALLKELNVTAVRLAHYQHDQYFYDLTDRNGLVVWAEIPLVNSINPTQAFYDNATQQMTELIRQNYNHPSIMFWGIQNEVGSPAPNNSPLFNTLNNLIHTEDPTRLSTFANYKNDVPHPSDLVGVNYYGGWYHDTYDTFATWADATHQQYPNDKIAISEFGAGASLYFHSNSPVMQDHSEEYQNLYHEAYWKAMKVRPYLWGKFVWNLADFASDNRNEGDTPGRNDKGLVSYDRTEKKDAFYWYKANWSNETFVYITGQRYWNAPYLTRPLSRPI